MKFGSVKFFKCLILIAIALTILTSTVGCVALKVQNNRLKAENASMEARLNLIGEQKREEMALLPYQSLFPDMVCEPAPKERTADPNTVYLTFDDGPSAKTAQVLDILAQYNVKATFFVTGQTDEESLRLMKRIVDEGHAIGVHTYSHEYTDIYRSVEAYLDDFYKDYALIEQATGIKTNILRFAGGSVNAYNTRLYEQLIAEMTRRGFTYYDWNVASGDAARGITANTVIYNVLSGIDERKDKSHKIVLMHDTNDAIVQALPTIIGALQEQQYHFEALTNKVVPANFVYPKGF